MPSPFDKASFGSNNKPAALLEMALSLQASEAAVPAETRPNNVSVTIDVETGEATIAATLPIGVSLDAYGHAIITAVDYLP